MMAARANEHFASVVTALVCVLIAWMAAHHRKQQCNPPNQCNGTETHDGFLHHHAAEQQFRIVQYSLVLTYYATVY